MCINMNIYGLFQVTIGTAGKATELITQHVIMVKDSEKLDRSMFVK